MTPALTRGGSRRPTSPDDVRDASLELQLPVRGMDSQAHLLWLVVHYLNAPLPPGWFVRRRNSDAIDDEKLKPLEYLDHSQQEMRTTHPLQQTYREVVRNLTQHPVPSVAVLDHVDALGWLAFADTDNGPPYFYNFRTGQMAPTFPDLAEIASSPLAQPRPVSLAQDAYLRTTPAFLAARSHIEMMLADGVATPSSLEADSCACRSAHLWSTPLHLSPILLAAQSLGINAFRERRFMWIAHLSLCLPLPAGWTVHPTTPPAAASIAERKRRKRELSQYEEQRRRLRRPDGELPPPLPSVFYHHALLGFSAVQWEPPQLSYCRGLLHALRKYYAVKEAQGEVAEQSAEEDIENAAVIRQRLRKQQAQVTTHAQVEREFVSALSGAKRITLSGQCLDMQDINRGDYTFLKR